MSIYIDTGWASLNKNGEELCGDNVELVRTTDSVMAVLADGLGSGVKANILSKMTAKIIATMLEKGASLEEVVDTVSKTLPVCQKRNIAYSTFTIVQVKDTGETYIVEFDNPRVFYFREGELANTDSREAEVCGKRIKETHLWVRPGDTLIVVSDGIIHAGVGEVLNLGWQWDNVAEYLQQIALVKEGDNALGLSRWLLDACDQLYADKPGDDATVLSLVIRTPRLATVAVGPPQNRADDAVLVQELLEASGKKVVCGGTTGTIVAKALGREIEADLEHFTPALPPTGHLDGVDLVTEGIITLSKVAEYLKISRTAKDLPKVCNGAVDLAKVLLESDQIRFLVGRAINPAHQNPSLPIHFGLKMQVVAEITEILRNLGKQVAVEYL